MGFLSRKSKAAEPVAAADNVSKNWRLIKKIIDNFCKKPTIKWLQIFKGNDATKRLASVEEELKAANLKVDVLTGQLADANHNLNQVTLRIIIKKTLGEKFNFCF